MILIGNYQMTFFGILPFYAFCWWIYWMYYNLINNILPGESRGKRRRNMKNIGRIVLIMAILLPWMEEGWIVYNFEKACQDAGNHVYKTVQVDGFYTEQAVDEKKYKFIEHSWVDKFKHVEYVNGKKIETVIDRPVARYFIKRTRPSDVMIKWHVFKTEVQATDSVTNEILGKNLSFYRTPNTADYIVLSMFGDTRSWCYGPLGKAGSKQRSGLIADEIFISNN